MIDLAFFVLSSTSIKTELNIISPFSTGFILLLLPLKNLLIDASLSIPKILFFPPTIPRSETNPVPCGKTLLSAVATWVWVPTNAVILPSRYQAKAAFSDVASACKSIKNSQKPKNAGAKKHNISNYGDIGAGWLSGHPASQGCSASQAWPAGQPSQPASSNASRPWNIVFFFLFS